MDAHIICPGMSIVVSTLFATQKMTDNADTFYTSFLKILHIVTSIINNSPETYSRSNDRSRQFQKALQRTRVVYTQITRPNRPLAFHPSVMRNHQKLL